MSRGSPEAMAERTWFMLESADMELSFSAWRRLIRSEAVGREFK